MQIVTRHGWLLGVVGAVRCFDGIWFAPVRGQIEEPQERPSHFLHDYVDVTIRWEGFDLGDTDWPWVRAVLPGVFGYSPLHVDDGRWFNLDAAFVAVLLEGEEYGVAYPFACTDLADNTGLVFSRLGPDVELMKRIAEAFWGLLRTESTELTTFSVSGVLTLDELDEDAELEIGYRNGKFHATERHDPTWEDDAWHW